LTGNEIRARNGENLGKEVRLMAKKAWIQPTLEVLDVRETMAGWGQKEIDWVTTHDADLYDPS